MASEDGLKDPYLTIINISTSKHLNLYNKAIVGLTEIDRYDLTRSKRTDFYQELEYDLSKFEFKAAVLFLPSRYGNHVHT